MGGLPDDDKDGCAMSVFGRVRALLRSEADRTYTADLKPLMDFSTIDLEKIRTDLIGAALSSASP